MEIESFDDLRDAALRETCPQRLLVVLLRAEEDAEADMTEEAIQGRGTLTPVMATDLEITENLRLDALAEEADGLGHQWDLLLMSVLQGNPGQPLTSEQAGPYIKQMVESVMSGTGLDRYAVFDRAGCPVRLSRNVA
ncbi:hypothetical protein M0534_05710 [Methylonatrum kenyense]|uniref:hypothetical protein n=1 Tax=Methylonatrum kenyense TaxID=455253 RepID=UPI0020BE4F48|nr:hypothetical protein [Methylonatrum kenyense]MCK8515819.1 hypothetical protein [Methylonatrum kenyense]